MQSKKNSAIEVIINVGSGYFSGMLVQWIVFPWFGLETSLVQNALITAIYTIVSFIRGYIIRRVFNKYKNN